VTANAVYTVPDVLTGAPSHIAGAPLSLRKAPAPVPAAGAPGATKPGTPANGQAGGQAGGLTAKSLRVRSGLALRSVRRSGISASFLVPAGAKFAQVELRRGSRTVARRVVRAGKAGSRQTVRLSAKRVARGSYTLVVKVGAARNSLGQELTRRVSIR
jgi:hypothetical protein